MEQQSRYNMKQSGEAEEVGYMMMGHAVHSQVIKIKQEIAKIKEPSLQLHMRQRAALLRDVTRLRSRSPLGLGGERTILVGNS